jgi:DNA-binding MurR/RpiR family transcriptional regulator
MKCTCEQASREARNAALEEAAAMVERDTYVIRAGVGMHSAIADDIRALKTAKDGARP